jgi:REP element-mobilizing transposase RayT
MINDSGRASLRVSADRRSIRLRNYDYTRPGFYFVTLCSRQRVSLFGHVEERSVHLSEIGCVVRDCWREIPSHSTNVDLDAFVIMPDHLHGIVVILGDCRVPYGGEGAQYAAPRRCAHAEDESPSRVMSNSLDPSRSTAAVVGRVGPGSLGAIVRSFKSAVTRAVNIKRGTPGAAIWQRNYHERIIRDDVELRNIRWYIATNPTRAAKAENG